MTTKPERPDLEGLKDQAVKHQEFELACGIRHALHLEAEAAQAQLRERTLGAELKETRMERDGCKDLYVKCLRDLQKTVDERTTLQLTATMDRETITAQAGEISRMVARIANGIAALKGDPS